MFSFWMPYDTASSKQETGWTHERKKPKRSKGQIGGEMISSRQEKLHSFLRNFVQTKKL